MNFCTEVVPVFSVPMCRYRSNDQLRISWRLQQAPQKPAQGLICRMRLLYAVANSVVNPKFAVPRVHHDARKTPIGLAKDAFGNTAATWAGVSFMWPARTEPMTA